MNRGTGTSGRHGDGRPVRGGRRIALRIPLAGMIVPSVLLLPEDAGHWLPDSAVRDAAAWLAAQLAR